MPRFRMAALSLHAMAASDRNWLLGQLPVAQRNRLVSMLDELQDLGVPREPVLLDEVTAETVSAPVAPRHPLVESLWEADPAALHVVLEHEPDAVAIALACGANWPWRQPLLDRFRSTGRDAIEAGLVNAPGLLPDKAFLALCDATSRALEQLPAQYLAGDRDNAPVRRRRLLEKLSWRR